MRQTAKATKFVTVSPMQGPAENAGLGRWPQGVKRLLSGFRQDQRGNFAIIAALMMPVLVGFAGVGSEVGLWYFKQQTLQSAADSGAVSAATGNSKSASDLSLQADAVTASYGLVSGSNGTVVTVNRPPQSGTHTATAFAVEVIVSQPQTRLMSALWTSDPLTIAARAVAIYTGGSGCVLALDGVTSGAATAKGTANVALNGCSLYDNSNSGSALIAAGTSSISALSVNVVGGVSGTSNITTTQGINTGQAAASDPYASVPIPSFSGCNQSNYSAKNTLTISPGVYCGGISVNAGAHLTLSPGIYYIDGGSFTVNGNASVSGTGVTLMFTSSTGSNWPTATINGGATINLIAPTSGPTAGIVIYGDRNMPVGTAFKFNGGSTEYFGGAVYLPKAALTFTGGANSNNGCTQIVADSVDFAGNANLAVNCNGFGTQSIGSATAQLVE